MLQSRTSRKFDLPANTSTYASILFSQLSARNLAAGKKPKESSTHSLSISKTSKALVLKRLETVELVCLAHLPQCAKFPPVFRLIAAFKRIPGSVTGFRKLNMEAFPNILTPRSSGPSHEELFTRFPQHLSNLSTFQQILSPDIPENPRNRKTKQPLPTCTEPNCQSTNIASQTLPFNSSCSLS